MSTIRGNNYLRLTNENNYIKLFAHTKVYKLRIILILGFVLE